MYFLSEPPKARLLTFRAMTLTELLVVLAILGILLLLAFPALKPLISRTYAMEARQNLKHLANLEENYFLEHIRYTDELSKLGFQQAALITSENGTAHYQVEVLRAGPDGFLAKATAVTDFDGDGIYNVWEIDKGGQPREIMPD